MAEDLLKLFLPSEIDWKRYKSSKVIEVKEGSGKTWVPLEGEKLDEK